MGWQTNQALFTWEKRIDHFTARAASGETFQVSIYQEVVGANNTVQRIETIEHTLTRIDDNTFKIVELDLIVKRV